MTEKSAQEVAGASVGAANVAFGGVRDFIPADQELTPLEKARVSHGRAVREYRPGEDVVPDFIPTEDDPSISSPTEQFAQSQAFAQAGEKDAARKVFAQAKEDLQRLTAVQAVDHIASLSDFDRDVYLIAEERGERRKGVLSAFPAPDPEVRRHFKRRRKR